MAKMDCPDSGHKLSHHRPVALRFGDPMTGRSRPATGRSHERTREARLRRAELQPILAGITILIGTAWVIASIPKDGEGGSPSQLPFLLCSGGLLWYLLSSLRSWRSRD